MRDGSCCQSHRSMLCNSVYIIYSFLPAAIRTGFPAAGTGGEGGRWHIAAWLAANPQHRRAMGWPGSLIPYKKMEVGACIGCGQWEEYSAVSARKGEKDRHRILLSY